MLEDFGRHTPKVAAVLWHAMAKSPLDLGVRIAAQVAGQIRRIEFVEALALQIGAMASGAAENVGNAPAVRNLRDRLPGLRAIEGDRRWLGLAARKSDE